MLFAKKSAVVQRCCASNTVADLDNLTTGNVECVSSPTLRSWTTTLNLLSNAPMYSDDRGEYVPGHSIASVRDGNARTCSVGVISSHKSINNRKTDGHLQGSDYSCRNVRRIMVHRLCYRTV